MGIVLRIIYKIVVYVHPTSIETPNFSRKLIHKTTTKQDLYFHELHFKLNTKFTPHHLPSLLKI